MPASKTKKIDIDYLFADEALIYRPNITSMWDGVLLQQNEDGMWRSSDIEGEYLSPEDAMKAAEKVLPIEP